VEASELDERIKAAVGALFLELVTAKAVIEQYQRAAALERSGSPDGARGADGPAKEGSHG